MEIRIGVQHVARELVVETDQPADQVVKAVETALAKDDVLTLEDSRGRRVLVPTDALAYVEIGAENPRHVGFLGGS